MYNFITHRFISIKQVSKCFNSYQDKYKKSYIHNFRCMEILKSLKEMYPLEISSRFNNTRMVCQKNKLTIKMLIFQMIVHCKKYNKQ